MLSSFRFARSVVIAGIAISLITASASADEKKGPPTPKGKGEQKPNILQLDLNKLPPDLAKQLQKYLAGADEKKVPPKEQYGKGNPPPQSPGKGNQPPLAKGGEIKLPPGLANKPINHPGRVNFLKNAGQKMSETKKPDEKKPQPPTPPSKSGKPKDKKKVKLGDE